MAELTPSEATAPASTPRRTSWVRWSGRILLWMFYLFIGYALILLVGLIPVNNGFEQAEQGIEILVVSNAVHADVILPIQTSAINWKAELSDVTFSGDISEMTHVAIGWGDRGFFLETPTWDEFKFSTAANALLLPSETCLHVSFVLPEYYQDAAKVTITEEQYQNLVDHIQSTFARDTNGKVKLISGYAYHSTDAFFEANGRYHLLNTCNSWVGRGLKKAGVRVPWLSSMPKTPMLYIKSKAQEE